MTADKVTLRLNALVCYRVTHALKSVSAVDDSTQAIYREARLALRAVIGGYALDDVQAGMERGPILRRSASAAVSNLPMKIARRELKVLAKKLEWPRQCLQAVEVEDARGPGNVVTIEMESERLTEVFTGFGERGVSAEKVAARAAGQALDYLSHDVPVGRYLADQLLVPMVIAGGGRFRTVPPSRHTLTNIDIIRRFMDLSIDVTANEPDQWEIGIYLNPGAKSGSKGTKA